MTGNIVTHKTEFRRYLAKEAGLVNKNLTKKVIPRTELEDYKLLRIVGRGSCGEVVCSENIISKKTVAIKMVRKEILKNSNRLTQLRREIRILNSINFEFLISLDCYFTNKCYIFLVLPFVGGGKFFQLLKEVKKFDELTAKFFAGQVVLAIDYLHYMGIIYRDLKPENLMLDIEGYLKLVDFGFAKKVEKNLTYTFCGTSEYLAPEILINKGYNKSPDWWTLGILLYEVCCGSPPFTAKNDYKLFEKILDGHITWPSYFSAELKSLIQGLLQVDKTKRLGFMKNGSDDIKKHEWFATMNWNALWHKTFLPPFKLKKLSNIDCTKTKELSHLKSNLNCALFSTNDDIEELNFGI